MAKTPPNSGKPITPKVVQQVRELAKHNTPTPLIAYETGRSEASIRNIASDHDISLMPTNKSPYGTKK